MLSDDWRVELGDMRQGEMFLLVVVREMNWIFHILEYFGWIMVCIGEFCFTAGD